MNTNMTELNLNEMEMVNGGTDTAAKGAFTGVTLGTCALAGGAFGSLGGPVGTFVGTAVGAAVGGVITAVVWFVD